MLNPMSLQYMALLATAQELASVPRSAYSLEVQTSICRKHGIFLDNLTDDEFDILNDLVIQYRGGN